MREQVEKWYSSKKKEGNATEDTLCLYFIIHAHSYSKSVIM